MRTSTSPLDVLSLAPGMIAHFTGAGGPVKGEPEHFDVLRKWAAELAPSAPSVTAGE